jgi:hypothetical protein
MQERNPINNQDEDLNNPWNTMPWTENQLINLGISPTAEPQFPCPVLMPGTLSALNTADYTRTYEELLGWFGYLTEKATYAKSMVIQCKNELTWIEVSTKRALYEETDRGKKLSAAKLEIQIESNPRYSELKVTCQKWEQLRDALQGRLDTVDANLKVVSRHIELRKLEKEGVRQQSNMPGRNRF